MDFVKLHINRIYYSRTLFGLISVPDYFGVTITTNLNIALHEI
ncbi:hypothetical protein [Rhodohalobacter sp.]